MIQKKLREYEKLEYSKLKLNHETREALEHYLKRAGLGSAFEFYSDHLKATQYVGIVSFRGRRIDVLPKLLSGVVDKENDEEIRLMQKNLLIMLSYTHQLNIKDSDVSKFDLGKDNLLDVYIYLFARDLMKALQKEGLHSYERKEQNISFIKGKINFSKDQRINKYDRSKTVCEFSSFERDNIINQTFLFLCEKLLLVTNNSLTRQYLNQSLKLLDGVTRKNISYMQIRDTDVGRSFEIFKTPFQFAKIFLRNSTPSLANGSNDSYCVMFDMNAVFEEFIYSFLNRYRADLGISEVAFQRNRTLFQSWEDLSSNVEHGDFGNVRNDIYIKFEAKGRAPLIIDTKYKRINSVKDISTQDYFQLLTYRHIEMKGDLREAPEIKLLYPEKDKHVRARLTFSGQDKTLIHVNTLSLRNLEPENLIKAFQEILEPKKA